MNELNLRYKPQIRTRREKGIALLISIFILLLISVVAIALIVSSGTESALAGNYRASTGVYYAALAGLEEARTRLVVKNPNYFGNTSPGFLPSPLPVGSPVYVINPLGSETVAPWDPTSAYPDTQYNQEFASSSLTLPNPSPSTSSIWNNSPLSSLSFPGPLYKWVRINAVSEQSLNLLVAPSYSTPYDSTTPIYYDGTQLNISGTGSEVLELTALAVLPNGSQKMLQYLVAPNAAILPPFPSAVTIVGNNVDYTGPNTNQWSVSGNDSISLGSCSPGPAVYAVGYTNNSDSSHANIDQGTFTAHASNYTGQGGATPNLGMIGPSIPANFQTPAGLNAVVQAVIQNGLYDVLITGNATGANLPTTMSSSNLMTIVVEGDLDISNSFHNTGYGLLIVTGNFKYDPDSSWYGIILLIGKGTMNSYAGRSSDNGQIVGGLFSGKIYDSSGHLVTGSNLPNSSDYNVELPDNVGSTMGGLGISYSSCWIKAAAPATNYKVLSFHEISQ